MADINSELEVINHLLEVEKNAGILIEDAKIEAEKNKIEATAKFNSEYKSKYDKMIAEKSAAYEKKLQQIKEDHEKEINDYKEALAAKPLNKTEFCKVLDELLFNA